jgi:hypothetical protein
MDSLKLFIDTTDNVIKRKIKTIYLNFFEKFFVFEKANSILKRMKFVHFHKLLILRNILKQFENNHNLIARIFFDRWKIQKFKLAALDFKFTNKLLTAFHKMQRKDSIHITRMAFSYLKNALINRDRVILILFNSLFLNFQMQ